ncbi:MAG: endoflagellar biosynthesis protein, partial [Nitrospiraceae bacterium]
MAEQTDNRTERASAKRRAEARKKGQVAISRDVPMAAVVLAGIALLYVLIRPA